MARRAREPDPWGLASAREEKFMPMGAFTKSLALLVGNELGVFECLSEGPRSLDEIVGRLKTDPKGTRILLDALVALRYLAKSDGFYENEPDAERYLTRGSPEYMGTRLRHSYRGLARWLRLEDMVRKGQKHKRNLEEFRETAAQRRRREKSFALGLNESSRATAARLSELLDLDGVGEMLDIGGGAGTYSITFANKWPKLKPTIFELPVPARVARQQVKKAGVDGRVRVKAGDFLKDDLGRENYDAAFMSNIIHIYGPGDNLKLIRKAHRALKSGGRIFLKDMLVNDGRDAPFYPVMFALTMLMFTDEGDAYSRSQVIGWLREAGFTRIRHKVVIPHESSMLIGHKK